MYSVYLTKNRDNTMSNMGPITCILFTFLPMYMFNLIDWLNEPSKKRKSCFHMFSSLNVELCNPITA